MNTMRKFHIRPPA